MVGDVGAALGSSSQIIQALLVGGAAIGLKDFVQYLIRRAEGKSPKGENEVKIAEQGVVEKTLLNLSKGNDELSNDVALLRDYSRTLEQAARSREEWWQARWDVREERWVKREAAMQAEMDMLRSRMVSLINELDDLRSRLDRE